MALNPKQQTFVDEYLINGQNALQAYMKAYPKATYRTAHVNSCKLLTIPEIREFLLEKQGEVSQRNNVTKDELVNILLSIARNEANRNVDRINSVLGIAKMCGYITNRVDITSKGKSITLGEMIDFTEDFQETEDTGN